PMRPTFFPYTTLFRSLRVQTHRVVDARAVLHQAGKDVVDIADRKRIVGAVIARGSFRSCPPAVPCLAQWIAIAHEQDVFSLGSADRKSTRLNSSHVKI